MKRVRIVGSGQRVRDAALPAFLRAADRFELAGIHSRTPKRIESEGRTFDVAALEELDDAALAGTDVLYMVVAKDAVPAVLRGLTARDVSSVDLLIDTPVLRFKWMGHAGLLDRFRDTWVTEDCATLPCYDAIDAFLDGRALERVRFDRAAYAYHGVAMGRTLLRGDRVRSASRKPLGDGRGRREIRFAGGGAVEIVEPRDYSAGRVELAGAFGAIADDPATPHHRLAPVVADGACVGFRVDDTTTDLSPVERELMGTGGDDDRLTSWMEGMKRVGFLRLLHAYDQGRGAYPLAAALEDTVVDYHLERFGRYVTNPFTSPHVATSRLFLKLVTRLAER